MNVINKLKNMLKPLDNEIFIYFTNGVLQKFVPPDSTNYYTAKYLISDGIKYNLENETDIRNIAIPQFKNTIPDCGVTVMLDYVLRMKAGHLRTMGLNELSIVCLEKAYQLMEKSPILWSENDYMRLVSWLLEDGQFDKAEKEKAKIKSYFNTHFYSNANKNKVISNSHSLNTDLVEMSYHNACCSECAKYRGRIFSISGKNEQFPKLPDIILSSGRFHEGCCCTFYPFIYGISIPMYCKRGEEIEFSNRAFIDDRTEKERVDHEEYMKMIENDKQREIDRVEYYRIVYQIKDLAPKSFGAYRRMKNMNSKTFQMIKDEAEKNGILIQ